MISNASIAGIIFSLLISFLVPLILCIVFLRKTHAGIKPVIAGVAIFMLFALILEQILHYYALGLPSPVSETLNGSPWLYALYGALAAGVFEEVGRLFAFKMIIRYDHNWKHGVAYGIGHGGIESWLLLTISSFSNLMIANMINNGTEQKLYAGLSEAQAGNLNELIAQFITTEPSRYFLAGIERILAFILQIALSLLVLYAIRKGKYFYFFLAIFIHTALDVPGALFQKGVVSIWFVEIWLLLLAIGGLIWIFKSQKLIQDDTTIPPLKLPLA